MSRSGKKRRKHQILQTKRVHVDSGAAAADHVSHAQEPARRSASFGAMLLHARQERGISHDDVARDTRVAKRYLLALESESLSSLPGGLYSRAYLRTYAAYLGLDADSIVRDYDRTVQEQIANQGLAAQPDQIAALGAAIRQKELQTQSRKVPLGTFKGPVAVGIALVVLAGGVWVGARYLRNQAGMMPAPLSTADAVVSDTVAKSDQISGTAAAHIPVESELHLPDSEKEPVRSGAAPASTMLGQTPEKGSSEVRRAPTLLSVNDSGVGTDVVDRQLVGRSETFAVGTRIVFWTLVSGGRPGDTIRHVWFHRGRTVASVKLPVAGANWRTHSQRMPGPEADGEWVVEAQDEHGRVLARHAFRFGP
jgi:cytoskeletal protein RodZ